MNAQQNNRPAASLETTAAPHLVAGSLTARRMMMDVLIGLTPVTVVAVWFFRLQALSQIITCLLTAVATEAVICRLRGRKPTLHDGSVCITALILAFSLPPALPLYATVAGSFVAVGLGKMVFGGLGHNLFNPAMVGRAFLMVCFPAAMTSWTTPLTVHATTQPTPLAAAKFSSEFFDLAPMVIGNVAGCIGDTSAITILVGGSWVLLRGAGDWRLAAGMLAGVVGVAVVHQWIRGPENSLGWLRHLCAGGVMLGAFFIVTDPVTSPLTKAGRWVFGLSAGLLTMVIRLFAGYPEGVMFAVLICNAFTPLINRWTLPTPVGGKPSTS